MADFWWRNVNMVKLEDAKTSLSQSPAPIDTIIYKPLPEHIITERTPESVHDDSLPDQVDTEPLPDNVNTEPLPDTVKTEPLPDNVNTESLSNHDNTESLDMATNDTHNHHSPQDAPTASPVVPTADSPVTIDRPAMIERTDSLQEAEDPTPDIENPQPPAWYKISQEVLSRKRIPVAMDPFFNLLKAAITRCFEAAQNGRVLPAADLQKINDAIHKAPFLNVDKFIVRKSRLLYNDNLPRLFSGPQSSKFPWYIVEDAAELYTKWWLADFSSDLYRGIDVGRKKDPKINRTGQAAKLVPNYPNKRNGNFYGNGHLRNGQWWPTQLCAVRDGAHSAPVAGICGNTKTHGAYSCVMSGGTYENVDHGDEVLYYGTQSDDSAEATRSTQTMKLNIASKQPVRLLRSSKITGDNPYKPKEGLRYDGLYKVMSYEITDVTKQVHRFRLVREPDQGTIRYQGPEKRPTEEELAALDKSNKERGFLV